MRRIRMGYVAKTAAKAETAPVQRAQKVPIVLGNNPRKFPGGGKQSAAARASDRSELRVNVPAEGFQLRTVT